MQHYFFLNLLAVFFIVKKNDTRQKLAFSLSCFLHIRWNDLAVPWIKHSVLHCRSVHVRAHANDTKYSWKSSSWWWHCHLRWQEATNLHDRESYVRKSSMFPLIISVKLDQMNCFTEFASFPCFPSTSSACYLPYHLLTCMTNGRRLWERMGDRNLVMSSWWY